MDEWQVPLEAGMAHQRLFAGLQTALPARLSGRKTAGMVVAPHAEQGSGPLSHRSFGQIKRVCQNTSGRVTRPADG
jgi:hypothetical protein